MVDEGTELDGSGRKPAAFKDWLRNRVEILIWMPVVILMWLSDLKIT
ncbi:hypothetical protein OPKNFCMD_6780 [Methylobacterium crusticola]|uniref:Uncharacterized protein n=1 Tax=Methylobacterium crusticola TaxID=1697972 RepID=A0ABQ4R8D9_9HYPH|nr:hypothetical protein [Methylobacterium crusticola]GJD54000.1 hypothetical protein OPKNFCMD_6780 [Methylobacterium crusticola]